MAERPVFVPSGDSPGLVKEFNLQINWAPGFAAVQKARNIRSLHKAAASIGLRPLLEVSTKSDEIAGRHLSAFHLKVTTSLGDIPLECAYQGSKVFERGGPFMDLFKTGPREAKRDPRLKSSGHLTSFDFEGQKFPLNPKTVFYDWLYITALYPHREWLKKRLSGENHYAGFTDIEFNPNKSVNCQARSCALLVALMQTDQLDHAVASPTKFIDTISKSLRRRPTPDDRLLQLQL